MSPLILKSEFFSCLKGYDPLLLASEYLDTDNYFSISYPF